MSQYNCIKCNKNLKEAIINSTFVTIYSTTQIKICCCINYIVTHSDGFEVITNILIDKNMFHVDVENENISLNGNIIHKIDKDNTINLIEYFLSFLKKNLDNLIFI